MDASEGSTRPRLGLARDERGRHLFVPWHPFSRSAYVLPTADDRSAFARRAARFARLWLAVVVGLVVARTVLRFPAWWVYAAVLLAWLDWASWTRRYTRGLERARYAGPRP